MSFTMASNFDKVTPFSATEDVVGKSSLELCRNY